MYYGRWERRKETGSKYALSDVVNGILAGLVAVTAPCAFIDPWAAFIIGCTLFV